MTGIWLLLDFLVLVVGGQIVYPGQYSRTTVVTNYAPVSGQYANYPTLQTVSNSQSVQINKQSNQEYTLQSSIARPESTRFNPTHTTQLPFINPSVSPIANSITNPSLGNWNNHVSCYQFAIYIFFYSCIFNNANNLS